MKGFSKQNRENGAKLASFRQKADVIQSRFKMYDQDEDGMLSFDEFKTALGGLGLNLSDTEARQIWEQAESGAPVNPLAAASAAAAPPAAPAMTPSSTLRPATAPATASGGGNFYSHETSDKLGAFEKKMSEPLDIEEKQKKARLQEQRVERIAAERISTHRRHVEQIFAEAGGRVRFEDFRKCLNRAGFPLGDDDCDLLWDKIGGGERGTVTAHDLVRACTLPTAATQSTTGGVSINLPAASTTTASHPHNNDYFLLDGGGNHDAASDTYRSSQAPSENNNKDNKLFRFHREQQPVDRAELDAEQKKELIVRSHLIEALKRNEEKLTVAFGDVLGDDHHVTNFDGFSKGLQKMGVALSDADKLMLWDVTGGNRTGQLDIRQLRADLAAYQNNGSKDEKIVTHDTRPAHMQTSITRGFSAATVDRKNHVSPGTEEVESIERRQRAVTRKVTNQRLRDHLANHRRQILSVFETASAHELSESQLRDGLRKAGVMLSDVDFRKIWRQASQSSQDRVRYEDITEVIGLDPIWETSENLRKLATETPGSSSTFTQRKMGQNYEETSAPWAGSAMLEGLDEKEKKKRLCADRTLRTIEGKLPDVRHLFNTYSSKGVYSLNQAQFKAGLTSFGVILSEKDAAALFHRIDSGGAGRISFAQVVDVVDTKKDRSGSPLQGFSTSQNNRRIPTRAGSVQSLSLADFGSDVQSQAQSALEKIKNTDIGNAHRFRYLFRKYDVDRDGRISHSEFTQGLRRTDVPLSNEEIQSLIAIADRKNEGYVSYETFASTLDEMGGVEANTPKSNANHSSPPVPPAAAPAPPRRNSAAPSDAKNENINTINSINNNNNNNENNNNLQKEPARPSTPTSVRRQSLGLGSPVRREGSMASVSSVASNRSTSSFMGGDRELNRTEWMNSARGLIRRRESDSDSQASVPLSLGGHSAGGPPSRSGSVVGSQILRLRAGAPIPSIAE